MQEYSDDDQDYTIKNPKRMKDRFSELVFEINFRLSSIKNYLFSWRIDKNHKKPLALFGLALTASIITIWLLSAPRIDNEKITLALQSAGFEVSNLPKPQQEGPAIIYKNIDLDKDGFSTISTLKLYHGFLGGLKAIEIEGLSLTGELNPNFEISLAGWDFKNIKPKNYLNLDHPPLLYFKDARIALLNEFIGGVNLNFDLQMRPQKQSYEIQAKLHGEQVPLSYTATLQGQIDKTGKWTAEAEVSQAKFSLWPIKATRISGNIKGQGQNFEQSKITGELQAGGLNINGLPWRNAALTLDGTLDAISMTIGAQSAGIDGLALSLNIEEIQNPKIYSGTLFADSMGNLFDYLEARSMLLLDRKSLTSLDTIKSVNFSFKGSPRTLMFKAEQDSQALITLGQLEPPELRYTLRDIENGVPLSLLIKTPEGDYTGNISLSDDRKNLVRLPERKPFKPKLKENSPLVDIFRP